MRNQSVNHAVNHAAKRPNIVVVGSINMDLIISAPRIPLPGETIVGSGFATIPGGKGANQAVAASRLGADVEMIGCLGDDSFGKQLMACLVKEQVGVDRLKVIPDTASGVALITVSEEGENTIVLSPGANGKLTPEMVREAEQTIAQADILVTQLEIPLDAVEESVSLAKKHQVPVILNPAPARKLPEELLRKIDILTPNETECRWLAEAVAESKDAELSGEKIVVPDMILSLRQLGVNQVVVTQGDRGVAYSSDLGDVVERPAFPVKAIDTTAAGDAFNAALAVALAEGLPFEEAVDFAQKAAALSVTAFGAQPSLPLRERVEDFR